MKKLIIAALALASASVFAAQNDVLLTFSTKGPDKYANGDTVADGECYCVVWTQEGFEFEGFEANGLAKGDHSKVVSTAPIAKDGRCPKTQFQINYKKAAALGAGHYGVYLLDTRSADTGKPQGAVLKDGVWLAKAINSWGLISDATTRLEKVGTLATTTVASTSANNKTTEVSDVPADVSTASIADIRVNGDQVEIDVKDTAAYLQYTVEAGDKPGDLEKDAEVAAQGNGDVITITYPAKKGGKFFKVIRN